MTKRRGIDSLIRSRRLFVDPVGQGPRDGNRVQRQKARSGRRVQVTDERESKSAERERRAKNIQAEKPKGPDIVDLNSI